MCVVGCSLVVVRCLLFVVVVCVVLVFVWRLLIVDLVMVVCCSLFDACCLADVFDVWCVRCGFFVV